MTLLSTRITRQGAVVQYQARKDTCKAVIARESAEKTYVEGTVLGRTLTGGAATSLAASGNTGNGVMGSVTVTGPAQTGTYLLTVTATASNAGAFSVTNPDGSAGTAGNVASAYSANGLAFTWADGSTDVAVGDKIYIAVTGTYKYKRIEATATDGSQNFAGVYIGDNAPTVNSQDTQVIAANTDTYVTILHRGPAGVGKDNLVFGSTVDTDNEKAAIYVQMETAGIHVLTQPNQL